MHLQQLQKQIRWQQLQKLIDLAKLINLEINAFSNNSWKKYI